jgi:hypothetical protein
MISKSGTYDAKSIHQHQSKQSDACSKGNAGSKKLRKRRRTIMSDYIDDLLDVGYDDFDDDVDDAVEL